jgi:hypothetical protein
VSTGDAMAAMEAIHAKLPPGTQLEWTGLSYEERLSGGQAPALYALSLLIVFLCLAALYELVGADLGDPGGAAGCRRRAARGVADRPQQRHLLAGRPDHHRSACRRRTRS